MAGRLPRPSSGTPHSPPHTLPPPDRGVVFCREGIMNYIDQNYGKVKNVYNETITLFFIHMVDTAIQQVGAVSCDIM